MVVLVMGIGLVELVPVKWVDVVVLVAVVVVVEDVDRVVQITKVVEVALCLLIVFDLAEFGFVAVGSVASMVG